jgi:hypothetical protein
VVQKQIAIAKNVLSNLGKFTMHDFVKDTIDSRAIGWPSIMIIGSACLWPALITKLFSIVRELEASDVATELLFLTMFLSYTLLLCCSSAAALTPFVTMLSARASFGHTYYALVLMSH